MNGYPYLPPYVIPVALAYIVAYLVMLLLSTYYVLSPPDWLPQRWPIKEDAPRKNLLLNLIAQPIILIFILITIHPAIWTLGPPILTFLIGFFSITGQVMVVIGAIGMSIFQILIFNWELQRALTKPPYSFWRRFTLIFLFLISINLISFFGLRAVPDVIGLVGGLAIGAGLIGITPNFFLMRRWEKRHQKKLLVINQRLQAKPLESA